MGQQLTLEYPTWFLLFCILAGAIGAGLLYWRSTTFKGQSGLLNPILGLLRWLSVSIICFLLLGPLFKSNKTEVRKPVILIATDVSESVPLGFKTGDSLKLANGMAALSDALGAQYEVRKLAFGETVREDLPLGFPDKQTDIAALFSAARDQFDRQNLGAVILATDGIMNEGSSPLYSAEKLGASVYSIALGDTVPKKDCSLINVFHNNIVYLDDQFSVQVDVQAYNFSNANATLSFAQVSGGQVKTLQSQTVAINSNNFFLTKEFLITATAPGVQHYRISIGPVQGDVNPANNVKDIYVEVLDSRQKILLLAHSPHPDIAALRQSLGSNKNYQITTALSDEAALNIAQYDFVVLHQLPAKGNPATSILSTLDERNIPTLFITGSQTDFAALNAAQNVVQINSDGRNTNEVQPQIASAFQSFVLDPQLVKDLPNYTPLSAPFGDTKALGGSQVLLYQRIGKVDTQYPLLAFNDQNAHRRGVLLGENLWRWRLFDFLQHKSHVQSDELIGKMVQYLSTKEDNRKFRVSLSKNLFKENERIAFGGELYNDNFELVNTPEVQMTLTDEAGKEFKYNFNKTATVYQLDAGTLPVGTYSYKAGCNFNGAALNATGSFTVQAIQVERYETLANHTLLRQLAEQNGGAIVGLDSITSLARLISQNTRIQPVMYQTNSTNPLLNYKWLFGLLLLLLGAEWVARRYFGTY